jgi:hypothetical protein
VVLGDAQAVAGSFGQLGAVIQEELAEGEPDRPQASQ